MINYFDVLNISENAEPEVIKASYRALSRKYHPDNYKGDKEEADRKMKLINEAFTTLSDDRLRALHLQALKSEKQSKKTSTDTNSSYSNSNDYNRTKSENASTPSTNSDSAEDDKVTKIVMSVINIIIIVSIICCIVHFGPNIWSNVWENISSKISEIRYGFSP